MAAEDEADGDDELRTRRGKFLGVEKLGTLIPGD